MNKFTFYNDPDFSLTRQDYDTAAEYCLDYIRKKFPDVDVYQVGGLNIVPGISDLDYLIVSQKVINGNDLYLRKILNNSIKKGILIHEFFAVDHTTFKNLYKLTSFQLTPLITTFSKLQQIESGNSTQHLFQLMYYTIMYYPVLFVNVMRSWQINTKVMLSQLKKILYFETYFKQVSGSTISLVNDEFRNVIDETINMADQYGLHEKMNICFNYIDEFVRTVFTELDRYIRSNYNEISDQGFIESNKAKIRFSNHWKDQLYDEQYFYMPSSFHLFNLVLSGVQPEFLNSINFSQNKSEVKEFMEIGASISHYLNFCNQSNIAQLIFDMDFSIKGHNSGIFRIYSLLSRIKHLARPKKPF